MSKLDHWIDNKIVQNISVWVFIFLIALVSIQSDNIVWSAFLAVIFLAAPVYIHNLKILPLFFTGYDFVEIGFHLLGLKGWQPLNLHIFQGVCVNFVILMIMP